MQLLKQFERFEVKVENHLAYAYTGVVSFGSCLPRGVVRCGDEFHAEDRGGRQYPLEWRPLIHGDDGSIAWAYFSLPVDLTEGEFQHYKVVPGGLPTEQALSLEQRGEEILIRNGDEEIRFHAAAALGLAGMSRGGEPLLEGFTAEAEMIFAEARYAPAKPLVLTVVTHNALEAVVQAAGDVESEAGDRIFLRIRYKICRNKPGVDVNAYFSHRGDLDEELRLHSMSLSYGLRGPVLACVVRQNACDNFCQSRDRCMEGGIAIHGGIVEDLGQLGLPCDTELWPFFRKSDRRNIFGSVAPYCEARLQEGGVLFSWQRSTALGTNSFQVSDRKATLSLVSQADLPHRIPQGFSRSFDFSICMTPANCDGEQIFQRASVADYCPLISIHPAWFQTCGVDEMGRLLPYSPHRYPRFERQLWREFAMPYRSGFYDYGDYPSGRGTTGGGEPGPPYTWNNNEEDHLKGIAWMLMRTGDPSYGEDLKMCARHLLEVDRLAFSTHPLQNGVLIAHAPEHFDGAGYPSHCWAEGLLLYFKLTGDEDAREAFFQLCECLLHWAQAPDAVRFADAREMGVPLTNFAQAYRLSGEEKYLEAARVYLGEFKRLMSERGGLIFTKGARLTPYAEYVAVEGLWDFYELMGGEDVRVLLMDVIEWIWRTQIDATGVYDARSTSESMLHIFYIAWKITNDEAWLERGRTGLDAALSQSCVLPLLKFGNNGAYYGEASRRGWFEDKLVPLDPCRSTRAVFRHYGEPVFSWEKSGLVQ